MKLLAIESSGLVASVAVVEDDVLLAEYTVNYKKTHSQTLLPMLDAVAQMIELDLSELSAVAVSGGPGSFTGLRIGSATAKGLALALDKPIVPVPTLAALAYNAWGWPDLICPIMDARRNQVYTGLYRCRGQRLEQAEPDRAAGVDELAEGLNGRGSRVLFLGDGVAVYRERLEELLTVPHAFAPAHMNRQRAGSVAALGLLYYQEGRAVSAEEHAPEYLRAPQAERERAKREGKALE